MSLLYLYYIHYYGQYGGTPTFYTYIALSCPYNYYINSLNLYKFAKSHSWLELRLIISWLQVCDNTGKCLCQDHVGGTDCSKCQEGYSNFPYCNQCENGYFGYPNCNKCDCVAEGVTPQICDQATGVCDCKLEGIGGSQCDSCKAYYTNYPLCEKAVVDGTLSSWGQWTSWTNLGRCGQYHDRRYNGKCLIQ